MDHHIFGNDEGSVEMLVAVLGSGQVFGELAVLDPNGRTPSSAVWKTTAGLGGPGISSNPSTSLKSNSFSMILEPLILASRVLDD